MKQIESDWTRRRLAYGFVESVTPALDSSYSRVSLVLDCIDVRAVGDGSALSWEREALAIVRLITTPTVLRERFGLAALPSEGQWAIIELDNRVAAPRVWVLSAVDSYSGPPIETRLARIAMLPPDDTLSSKFQSQWASGAEVNFGEAAMARLCTIQPAADASAAEGRLMLQRLYHTHIRVVDVGQASCNAFHAHPTESSPILGFFDVGAPIFFNRPSFRKLAKIQRMNIDPHACVILSHWDFDHYALALRDCLDLKDRNWFAPQQPVGPNTAAFQQSLGSRLGYLQSSTVPLGGNPVLHRGLGPPRDRNSSGYVLRFDHPSGARLLTGDVSYEFIPPPALLNVSTLTVPHHAGPSLAPPPTGPGRAVASFGIPNKYRHPCPVVIASHEDGKWQFEATATHLGQQRGDRWL